MRALQVEQFDEPSESLKVVELDERAPKKGEVLIRVAGVGVGYFDGLLVRGEYQIRPPLPFIPGSSFSGTVEQLGEGVEQLREGQPVAGFTMMGAMVEKLTINAGSCFALPETIALEDAANFFIAYATGLFGLREIADLRSGEWVLVPGASGTTGSTAIEIARAMGARVVACASSEEKRQYCLGVGADAVVDYTRENWRDEVKSITGGGVNVVYDPVGGELSEAALRLLLPWGRHLVVGFVAGIARIPMNLPLLKRCSIHGVNWGGEVMANPAIVPPVIHQLIAWSEEGKLHPGADHVYELEQAAEAFSALFARRSLGTIVVRP